MTPTNVPMAGLPPTANRASPPRIASPPIICQPSPFAASLPIALRNPQPTHKHSQTSPPNFSSTQNGQNPYNGSLPKDMSFAYRDRGYQDFSKLMASSDDFFVIRRFQSLNAHVILYMQYRIAQIEERLQEIHEECKKGNPSEANNGSFRWDLICEPERDSLMCELTSLLHHYNQYIDTFTRIRQRPNAAKYQVQNVEEYFKEKTITEKERNFIIHKHDLVSINPTVSSPLGRLLEWSDVVVRLLRAKKDENSQVVDLVDYGSDTALANLTTGSIIALGCIMLLGPMWGLEFVTNSHKRLGIITGFLVGFMAFMACASVHKPFEVVAASAAYAAVLMVFMQIEAK